MLTITPHEARVLGVLVEKAHTTPAQYPLTLNGLTVGSNQKNNRLPTTNLSEDQVFDAVEGLRKKGLVREVQLSGSRVAKFRHLAREALGVETPALVILTELMLRGPESLGDIRQNAGRMHPLESLESVKAVLDELASRPEPLVREYPPPPGSRAKLYRQLLAPDAHAEPSLRGGGVGGGGGEADEDEAASVQHVTHAARVGLEARVEKLEAEVAMLRAAVRALATELGATTLPPG